MRVTRALETRIDLDGWRTLVALAESSSLTEAAAMLAVPRATLSRRLSRLEEELGHTLAHRTTRRMTLTAAGEELAERARAALEALASAEERARQAEVEVRGLLRVALAPNLASIIAPVVARLLAEHPRLQIELVSGTRRVDLVEEAFDVALRAGKPGDPRLIGRPLARMRHVLFARIDLLDRLPPIEHPERLTDLPCIVNLDARDRAQARWPLRAGGEVAIAARLGCNDLEGVHAACLAGVGIALLPELLAAPDVEAGVLAPVLPEVVGSEGAFWLLHTEAGRYDTKVRAFVDAVGPWLTELAHRGLLTRAIRRQPQACVEQSA